MPVNKSQNRRANWFGYFCVVDTCSKQGWVMAYILSPKVQLLHTNTQYKLCWLKIMNKILGLKIKLTLYFHIPIRFITRTDVKFFMIIEYVPIIFYLRYSFLWIIEASMLILFPYRVALTLCIIDFFMTCFCA